MITDSFMRLAGVLVGLLAMSAQATAQPLTLDEVERLATQAPGIERLRQQARSHDQDAVAAGELSDPELITEIRQFPLDNPGFQQEQMTQLQVGLRQAFPPGDSLKHRRQREQARGDVRASLANNREREIRRNARIAYLDVIWAKRRHGVLRDRREVFERLVETAERKAASGTVSRQDVLRAEVELERLKDRVQETRQQLERARASLARWIGNAAHRPVPDEGFPKLPDWRQHDLKDHPLLEARKDEVRAKDEAVELAEEQYKPGWRVQGGYGLRTNPAVETRHRVGIMLSIDLPLFTENRQDQRLAARHSEKTAAMKQRQETYRTLQREVAAAKADWRQLGNRISRYQDRLLEVTDANAEAADKAYASGTNDFTALMDSRLLGLESRLELLRLKRDRKEAQAQLLYLLGGEQS